MASKSYEMDMCSGPLPGKIIRFAIPLMLSSILQLLFNAADVIVVGQFAGSTSLAAVGSTGALINLLTNIFLGLSIGTNVLVARYYGAHQDQNIQDTIHTSMMIAILGGLILILVGCTLTRPLLELMGTPLDVIDKSVIYMRILFIGCPFMMVYNFGSAILRAVGDSKRPLYFLIACCLTNVLLDLLFVVGLGMGVAGAAVATVLSQVVSVILTFGALMRSKECFRFSFKELRMDMNLLKSMLRIGLPVGLQSTMYSISNILVQSSINGFGTDVIAAWTAVGKVDSIFWMAINAFGIAVTTFAGQNFGAGKYDRVHKCVRVSMGMAMGMTIVLSGLLLLTERFTLGLFCRDAEVLAYGEKMMFYMVTFYFTYVPIEVLSGAIKGAGDSLRPMIITLLGICVLRVAWVLLMVPIWHNLFTLSISYPISWLTTAIIFIIYYFKSDWMQRCIRAKS